jgi:hypothetical protein
MRPAKNFQKNQNLRKMENFGNGALNASQNDRNLLFCENRAIIIIQG